MIELAASYRRYNCCIERFVVIGRPSREQLNLHALVEETLSTMLADHDKGLAMGSWQYGAGYGEGRGVVDPLTAGTHDETLNGAY